MTVTCPNGHRSQADDYCDVCGSPIDVVGPVGCRGASAVRRGHDGVVCR